MNPVRDYPSLTGCHRKIIMTQKRKISNEMKILCTICARGGSKDVPNKNIRELAGKPLIAHTIEQALASPFINRVVVSTDSERIAKIAKGYRVEVPFMRPSELATDTAAKLPVVQHAVKYYIEKLSYNPDYVIDLDPTSPLRMQEDITKCLHLIQRNNVDAVITGYRSNKNPYFNMVEIDEKGYVKLSKPSQFVSRQEAPPVYSMNASIYVWKTPVLLKMNHIFDSRFKLKLIEMPPERSIDIDHELDFQFIEFLKLKSKK